MSQKPQSWSEKANVLFAHETAVLKKTLLNLERSKLYLAKLEQNVAAITSGKVPVGCKPYKTPQLGDAYVMPAGFLSADLGIVSMSAPSFDDIRKQVYLNLLLNTAKIDIEVATDRISTLQSAANLEFFLVLVLTL